MAQSRFVPDPNFEIKVQSAAIGVAGVGRGTIRRRRTTLLDIADKIVDEAKLISDSPPEPRRSRGGLHGTRRGQRRASSDFRRSSDGPTYRSQFISGVTKENGRMVVYAANARRNADHNVAESVEFGSGTGAKQTHVFKRYKIPIKKSHAEKLKKLSRTPLTQQQKVRKAEVERGRYWSIEKKITKNVVYGTGIDKRLKKSTQEAIRKDRLARQKRARARDAYRDRTGTRSIAIGQEARAETAESKYGRSIVTVDKKTGQPVLLTRARKTYTKYAILRRAMRNVVRRNFE